LEDGFTSQKLRAGSSTLIKCRFRRKYLRSGPYHATY
jgi:hypothetical protein